MNKKVYSDIEDFKKENKELNTCLPFTENTDILKTPFKIKNTVVPNRLVCQAMEGCDGTKDGKPDVLTKRRYTRLAKGGSGLIWYEATAVLNEGRANPRQLFINENNLDAFKRHVEEIKETGLKENGYEPVLIMQATHSGRYSKPNGIPEPLIAYNNPIFEKDNPIPKDRIVTDEYIDCVRDALIKGALLAEKAGFDGVDIKSCHRYLNCELLSAYNREGRYGGCIENRSRLLRTAVKGAIENCKRDFIVTTRMNAYDGFPYPYGFGVTEKGGLTPDFTDAKYIIKELYSYGVRLIDITMGNPYFNPHVNRPFAMGPYTPPEHPLLGVARMLEGTKELKETIPEMAFISSALSFLGVAAPNVTAAYINNNSFDFAGFGRTILAYPDYAKDILNDGKMYKNKICLCCSKCTELMRHASTPGCVVRDREIYADLYKKNCMKQS